ncbi:nitrilase family protein [Vitiosangium sp. GDMCC 1.1324]|uniref:nitrilase family protein n=1 Tax=Vitiosangium sp. (strain GDMCC 1.1324) TaxID=2138576 RepID=UPI000D3CB72C|nr:nitrilase family protein [Vitiosangium sp. GDMCC 1.1324]PTL80744.1 acyltransferase [Vitiosangium sp. GDMCC 1.1324]
MTSIRVASVQFQHLPGDKAYNLEHIRYFAGLASSNGVKLIAFPEMCVTGYWHVRHLDRAGISALAEPVPSGPSVDSLRALAREQDLVLGAGLIEEGSDGRFYNAYAVCLPDGTVHTHRKLHAFESEHMASGDRYTVFDTPLGIRVGVLICWDNNLVENARATALLGADVLMAPHQTGGTNSRSPHAMGRIDPELWRRRAEDPRAIEAEFRGPKGREWLMRWLPARAHDNGMFLLFSNGVGLDDDEVRTGNAMILDPYGRILAETWRAGDDMVVADLDLGLLPLCTGRRWIRGRRPELYGMLAEHRGDELDPRRARFSSEPTAAHRLPLQTRS